MTSTPKWPGGGPPQYMMAASRPLWGRSTGPTLVVMFSWICGCCLANCSMRGSSQMLPSETGTDRSSRPPDPRPVSTSSVASSSRFSTCVTRFRYSAPVAVATTPPLRRSSSRTPRKFSSSVSCLLTALCVRHSSSAASVTLPLRAVASRATRLARAGRLRLVVLFIATSSGRAAAFGAMAASRGCAIVVHVFREGNQHDVRSFCG